MTTGAAPGNSVPTGTTVPADEVNTLADILSTCVNSGGGVAGDGSPCGQLFTLTTPAGSPAPTTITAASYFIEQNPTQNISELFALLPANAPFTPMLSITPVDWSLHPAAPSALSVTPSSINFPSTIVNFTAASQTITLRNSGSTDISISGIALTGSNAGDFTYNNSCTSILPANQTCTIQAGFSPAVTGSKYAYLTIRNSATSDPVAIALTGDAVDGSGALSVSPTSLSFSQLSAPQTITLTNSSTTAIAIQSITLSSQNFTKSSTCGNSVAANASCTLSVTATVANPDSATPLTAIIAIVAGDTIGIHTVPLSTSITAAGGGPLPPLSVSVSSLFFPSTLLNFSAPVQTFTVTNNAPDAILYSSSFTGAAANNYTLTDSCPAPLQGGQSCTERVTFTPVTAGAHNGSLEYTLDSGLAPVTIPVTGTGTAGTGGAVTLSPSSLSFTQFGVPAAVTVTNTGTTAAAIGPISLSSNYSGYAQTNNCGSSLDPQSICTIEVSATALSISYSNPGTLTVVTGDATGIHTLPLSTPVGSADVSVPGPIAFGSWVVGAISAPQTFYLVVRGDTDGSMDITGPDASAFSFDAQSGVSSISPDAACPDGCFYPIYFTPSHLGSHTATLVTKYGNATLTGTGSPAGPSFTLSGNIPNPIYQVYGPGTAPLPLSVTVLNNGSTPLNLSATMTGANASQYLLTNECLSTLSVEIPTTAGSGSCYLEVTFAPNQYGSLPADLNVTDNTSGISQTMTFMGFGQYPGPTVSPQPITFGDVQIGSISAPITTTVTAPDGHPVTVSYLSPQFGVTTTSCSATPCQIGVTFAPTATGTVNGTITFQDVVTKTSGSLGVRGTGGVPVVSLSPSMLSFATRNTGSTSIAQTVALTNSGNAPLNISSISITGTNEADFVQSNHCSSTIAVGAGCTFSISFSPSETGNLTAAVQILSDAPPAAIELIGTATAPSP